MRRIPELDFLKGVLILLVVSFHLVWFEQLHPEAKQVVYSFHMPGFLFVSGFLMNINKPPRLFLRTLLWLAVPYLAMEGGYVVMAAILPIREHIERLTLSVFLDRLLLHPLGPYWYLHALILCGAVYYYIYNNVRQGMATRFLLIGIAYFVFAHGFGILSFSSAMYFLAGAVLRQSGTDFVGFFRPSWLSVAAFALIIGFAESPNQASLSGILIAFTAISSLLWVYKAPSPLPLWGSASVEEATAMKHSPKGGAGRGLLLFLGRNSLPIYIFSPIFTVLCKGFVPFLRFDGTGLLFLLVSLAVCVGGSLLLAWLTDRTGLSRYLFGRRALSM